MDSSRYETIRNRVQNALARELENVHYVLAVWEIEAWLLLFPEAVTSFANGWQVPAKRRGRDTGKFQDPKRIFKDEISKVSVTPENWLCLTSRDDNGAPVTRPPKLSPRSRKSITVPGV